MNQKPIFGKGIGRRKSSIARVIIVSGTGQFIINQKPALTYLQENPVSISAIQYPHSLCEVRDQYDTIIQVSGGGLTGQAMAIKLAIARALCEIQESNRFLLKQTNCLTRDARVKERRKYGLKKARKAPQFSKR
jgi:small subunit ribosomal protein S9